MIFCASALRSDSGRVKLKSKPGDDTWLGKEPLDLIGVALSMAGPNTLDAGAVMHSSGGLEVLWWTLLGCISPKPWCTRDAVWGVLIADDMPLKYRVGIAVFGGATGDETSVSILG